MRKSNRISLGFLAALIAPIRRPVRVARVGMRVARYATRAVRAARAGLATAIAGVLGTVSLAPPASAGDSGVGVDTLLGNKLFPSGLILDDPPDPRGMSWLEPGTERTPTGFLYPTPFLLSGAPDNAAADIWRTNAQLDIGAVTLGGDDGNALWNRYVGWENGPIAAFEGSALRPSDGAFSEYRGSYLSGDDQFYKYRTGRYGAWSADVFARRQPNILSDNTVSIWDGVGTSNLTLTGGLVPGGSTPAEVTAVYAAQPERKLEVERTKEGLGFNYYFNREWTGYLDLSNEDRKGTRPFGGTFFFNFPFPNNGGVLETLKPIDDTTVNLNLGGRRLGGRWRMNFGYSGSFYRDHIEAFDFETPFSLYPVVPGATSAPLFQGEFSPEPDNDYHNLRATATRSIPLHGELSITGSAARMEQNDALLPPATCQGSFGITLPGPVQPFLYPCADWNTVAALSRLNAGLAIDTALLDATAVLQPAGKVTWRGELKYYREDYNGDYLAYNPLTGQYGYVAANGAQGSVVPGEAGIFDPITASSVITRIRNLPLDKKTLLGSVGADLRLSPRRTFGATLAYLRYEPTHRERSEVDDTSLKATWSDRALDWLTLRVNYTYLSRSGDSYEYDPYEFTYSTSLPSFVAPATGIPAHTVDAMRKYDLANRHDQKLDVMATFVPNDTMTFSASVRGESDDYAAEIGRQRVDSSGATFQWEWQPSTRTTASVVTAYEHSRLELANVNDIVSTSPDPSLGGPAYPLAAEWWADNDEANYTASASVMQQVRKVRLDASWNYQYSNGAVDYSFASSLALAHPTVAATTPGAFPAVVYRVNAFTLSAAFDVSERLTVRVFDYYERGDFSDWHYAGFDTQRVYDHRVYSDGGPHGYRSNVLGLMVETRVGERP